ncbi:hypothetical protein PpBr36_04820 [Pyricularia pennisetigena]|uniref:hypothetical protein n=1 Tax=Pyricularia pennisetigena TaxID=1578925 RepID=UPI00114FE51B|nr:hypothetical protein PpBr36_04820 [Pyricularia pennisetigena]TLS26763.1 hypothetical protein PpBr36_04820 [Pyricularia pennisetigena]
MKTSVILSFVTLVSAAVALPAVTTNTEDIHVFQRKNEIGTPEMHRRSATRTNKEVINELVHRVGRCLASEEVQRRFPDYEKRNRYCLNEGWMKF